MKLFKKTASVVLAMTMVSALCSTTAMVTTASAVDTGAETTKLDVSEHQYKAYQIFKGTQADTDNAVLCDIQWGEDIDEVALLTALQKMDAYKDCKTAEDVAMVLAKIEEEANGKTDTKEAREFAKLADQYIKKSTDDTVYGTNIGVTSTIDGKGLEVGYYLVVDTTSTFDTTAPNDDKNSVKNEAKNLSLLQLTKNTSSDIVSKTDIPKVEKKVYEKTPYVDDQKGTTGYALEEGYNDVADYYIGDDVKFMLIGTMPTTLEDYDTYKYVFHDTLSAGLTYNNDIEVFVDDDNMYGNDVKIGSGYTVDSKADGTLTISFDDVKSVKDTSDKALTVTKDSKIIVKYTAELNDEAVIGLPGNPNEVYLQYSNNPNFNGSGDNGDGDDDGNNDNNETGNTPKDKVIVFTYELDVTKEDSETAEKLEGAEFKLQNADGAFYKKVDIIDEENPENNSWYIEWVADENAATTLISENGMFKVVGIDDGTYTLTETKAPTGYNLLKEAIKITITAVTVNNQKWDVFEPANALTALSIKITGDKNATEGTGNVDTGIVDMSVKNNKGSLLPETGGMGTVAIYTVGTLLVVVAGVLLITKKRMSK
ncbi:MAG: isopeptide-forming domain-containing fimbrial protein [Acutalibacteraceae bacterium]|nr:isopeptide-forming domain-containing fimbrial protein [Acutalibacteraceae bacterium]